MTPEGVFLSLYFFILGAMVGSFLNVLIYRLPRNEGFVKGRSHCPHCHQTISWFDNIPLLSFVILRGRCRRCRNAISWRYPAVELIVAAYFLLSYHLYGLSIHGFVAALLFTLLLTVTFIDFEHYIIPDKITYPGMMLGLALSFVSPITSPLDSLLGLLIGGAALYLLALFGDWLFKKESLGGGDIKLAAMLGAFLGWKSLILIFFGGALLGLLYALARVIVRRQYAENRLIPFGPFLAAAALLAFYFGDEVIAYYLHNILQMP